MRIKWRKKTVEEKTRNRIKRRIKIEKMYNNTKTKVVFIVLLIPIIYFILNISNLGSGNSKTDVWVLAKHSVEQKLKSPSSAKFPSKSKATILENDNGCTVISYVDAENSFGAKVRSKFVVDLTKKPNGEYILESVYIE